MVLKKWQKFIDTLDERKSEKRGEREQFGSRI